MTFLPLLGERAGVRANVPLINFLYHYNFFALLTGTLNHTPSHHCFPLGTRARSRYCSFMTGRRLRVLSLSNAFPPGVTGRFPSVNPAGHANETRMLQALARVTRLSTIGLLPEETFGHLEPNDGSLGLEHELLLWERKPELWHRWRSWRALRSFYLKKSATEGPPEVLLVRNLTPVFNHFVRWLRRQNPRPVIILVFADSATLGRPVALSRRLRYALKPMQLLDDDAIGLYDACISYGIGTRPHFESRGIPWMWMPSAFNFQYDPPPPDPALTGPIRFGYFGALAEHAAVRETVQAFLDSKIPGSLHMCGFGKLSDELKRLSQKHPDFHFDGLLPKQSDCLAWAQKVDVLINPRAGWGLENSFPSKIFEFGMTGKAILTTRTGGVDEVLKNDALYFDADHLLDSLRENFQAVATMDRAELQRRGAAIRNRLLKDYNWDEQGRRMVSFIAGLVNAPDSSC
jgi:glycosyltransferase involved in cell wall biosynthesis